MPERLAMVPAERMPPLIEAARVPASAATRTDYRVLANDPSVRIAVAARPPDGVRPGNAEAR